MTQPLPALESRARGTLEHYETAFRDRHLLHGVIDHWASRRPGETAILNATRGTSLTWEGLAAGSRALAGVLRDHGFRKGDFLATSLPLTDAHIQLAYACFRLGVIHVPLDLRLSEAERDRALALVGAKGYVALRPEGAGPALRWDAEELERILAEAPDCGGPWPEVRPGDGAQVVFTTGSTGQPKAALLSHRGITAQNFALGAAFEFSGERLLVNLPPSHVGGQAELLMTTLFWGATAITLEVFDPGLSLKAIEAHGVTILGQIPAMFQMEWRHPDFASRDLSSLKSVMYGGQGVARPFLERLRAMGPRIATGLGLTEASGFCTYTELSPDVDRVAAGLGQDWPIYPMSIRQPMGEDGLAGAVLPDGEIGCVCFQGLQTFLGYVNDPEATARTVSRDEVLYTGDMGWRDELGLHFSGRARWVIKVAGYQVFPGDVEAHFCALGGRVAACGAVGAEHPVWSEAVMAFVEPVPGTALTVAELRSHARALTSYMRPLHYVLLEPGQMPLNRVGKVDMLKLKAMADEEVQSLKARGRWKGGDEEE